MEEDKEKKVLPTNKEFAGKNVEFIKACENVSLKPTVRQASKWRMKKGKAWKQGRLG